MSKINLLLNISIILLIFISSNANEINNEKNDRDNNNNKVKTEWTTQALIKYTLKHHGKDNYFICDPLNYISEEEKEVIYYRLETIYTKLNITTVFFILDKISLDGLNITNLEKEENDEFEDDEIVYKKNNTQNNNNSSTNDTLIKTEEERQREFKFYIAEVKKKLFNRKIFAGKESKSLVGIFTVEDLGKYLYVGRDYSDMVNQEEIKYLLEGKEYFMEKKNLYVAVDNLFSNFLYRYSPSNLDKFNKFMGFIGEMLGLGAIIFSYYLMNRKKEEQQPQRNPNNNNNKNEKKEEKKEEKKDDKKNEIKEEKKDDNKNNEKEKQD